MGWTAAGAAVGVEEVERALVRRLIC